MPPAKKASEAASASRSSRGPRLVAHGEIVHDWAEPPSRAAVPPVRPGQPPSRAAAPAVRAVPPPSRAAAPPVRAVPAGRLPSPSSYEPDDEPEYDEPWPAEPPPAPRRTAPAARAAAGDPARPKPGSAPSSRARKAAGSGRAAADAGSALPARPVRKRTTKSTRGKKRGQLVPTEAALIWGLLYDLLCLPVWLVGLLRGRARLSDGTRPLDRVLQFVLSARMTALLIAVNLLVFAVEIYARRAGWSRAAFVAHFTLSTDGLGRGEKLPLLTHFFSHASLMHLGGNMLALFVFGRVVERNLGPWRLLSCYLLAAVCSTALSLLVQGLSGRSVPTLGASGAVAGLVALGILLEPLAITFEALLPMPLFLVGWLAIAADFGALLSGTPDPVDHPAHLGGYLSVLLGYYALKQKHQAQARLGLVVNLATLLLMAGLWFFWGSRAG